MRDKPIPAHLREKTGKDRSNTQERRIAKETSGRRTPASGAMPHAPGDIVAFHNRVLLELKTTAKLSYRLEAATLRKISEEAFLKGKLPGMVITFEAIDSRNYSDWAIIPLNALKELMRDAS